MAKLFQIAKSISPVVVRIQQQNEVNARELAASGRRMAKYEKRMGKVCANAFSECKTARPQRRKYHNTLYKETMGSVGESIIVRRFPGSYITSVCKTKMFY